MKQKQQTKNKHSGPSSRSDEWTMDAQNRLKSSLEGKINRIETFIESANEETDSVEIKVNLRSLIQLQKNVEELRNNYYAIPNVKDAELTAVDKDLHLLEVRLESLEKVSDREVDLEEIQENAVRPAVSDTWSADFASACTQSAEGFDEAWVSGLNETRNFKTFTQTEDEKQEEEKCDADFWENLQKEWERMAKHENADVAWLTDYDNLDIFKEYTYANDNPFIDQSEPFEEGLRMLEKGDLPSAALAFEAAVQNILNMSRLGSI
ncbi:peroxisomal targeting signal 1 receptor [Trichonephila clavipes]|nr:peroxisomal targeting signal 1 receptor [Trichonephila clavipes]